MLDIKILPYAVGTERYIWLWLEGEEEGLFNHFGRFAEDPELSFSFRDADVCRQRVREDMLGRNAIPRPNGSD